MSQLQSLFQHCAEEAESGQIFDLLMKTAQRFPEQWQHFREAQDFQVQVQLTIRNIADCICDYKEQEVIMLTTDVELFPWKTKAAKRSTLKSVLATFRSNGTKPVMLISLVRTHLSPRMQRVFFEQLSGWPAELRERVCKALVLVELPPQIEATLSQLLQKWASSATIAQASSSPRSVSGQPGKSRKRPWDGQQAESSEQTSNFYLPEPTSTSPQRGWTHGECSLSLPPLNLCHLPPLLAHQRFGPQSENTSTLLYDIPRHQKQYSFPAPQGHYASSVEGERDGESNPLLKPNSNILSLTEHRALQSLVDSPVQNIHGPVGFAPPSQLQESPQRPPSSSIPPSTTAKVQRIVGPPREDGRTVCYDVPTPIWWIYLREYAESVLPISMVNGRIELGGNEIHFSFDKGSTLQLKEDLQSSQNVMHISQICAFLERISFGSIRFCFGCSFVLPPVAEIRLTNGLVEFRISARLFKLLVKKLVNAKYITLQ